MTRRIVAPSVARAVGRVVLLRLACPLALSACTEFAEGLPRAELGPLVRTGTVALTPWPEPAPGLVPIPLEAENLSVGFEAAKLTGRHRGRFTRLSGRLDWAPKDPRDSRLYVDVQTASIETDTPKLTKHLKSPDFFGVQTHPEARFALEALRSEGPQRFEAEGRLRLHGIERSIRLPLRLRALKGRVRAETTFVLDRKAFGIVYAGRPDDLIASEVVLSVKLDTPIPVDR